MTTKPEAVNAMTTPLIPVTPKPAALNAADLTPAAAWSRRGFHDPAGIRPARPPGRARLSAKAR